jgi:replication initiation and membrane attachment protein
MIFSNSNGKNNIWEWRCFFMKIITLLPADKYLVVNKTILTEVDRKNVVSLYEPIIGSIAISLYLTLWRDLDRLEFVSIDYTHHHLMTLLKTKLENIKMARETLEAVGLLKTYLKMGEINSYIYELYSPLSAKEFFSHPIFNVVLYNNIGKYEYDLLKKEYATFKIDTREYEDISKSFDGVFKTSSEFVSFDAVGREILPLNMQDQVDFDLLISSMPRGLVNERTFGKRMRELINNLAFLYQLDTLKMCEILRLSINEKGSIDKEELRRQTRKYYQYNHHGKLPTLIYRTQPEYLKSPSGDSSKRGRIIEVFENTSPYDFLKSKYNGANPTNRDLKLLETLMIDLALKPAVVNVLIDYTLKKNHNKLSVAFVETVAGHWKRQGIETANDAMMLAEKENKKYNKEISKNGKNSTKLEEPVWFHETLSKEEMSKEEMEEMESILKKYK